MRRFDLIADLIGCIALFSFLCGAFWLGFGLGLSTGGEDLIQLVRP